MAAQGGDDDSIGIDDVGNRGHVGPPRAVESVHEPRVRYENGVRVRERCKSLSGEFGRVSLHSIQKHTQDLQLVRVRLLCELDDRIALDPAARTAGPEKIEHRGLSLEIDVRPSSTRRIDELERRHRFALRS